ncbi:hypothetical protein F4827_001206 [Paraburkholderia bannensis]|uniref:DUF3443 domain-containing protein n=1 Tax=Paraburkholderia bannensis TaxID=765414 RepID=A0A7W9TTV6_9BURK|nr:MULTISPECIES: DUF3443 domain-containing protein [Paraburkholderia]MBB3256373.1 hypothetical protein [Paraburkholderia sp. WP4_3_2]MBB6101372.1 hypothetical protein [Paraburkholderia bannensis]
MNARVTLLAGVLALALAACGGGSGGSSAASVTTAASAPAASSPGGTGGTSGSSSNIAPSPTTGTVAPSTTPNVLPITVASTPTSTRNMLMASVTVCVPGTSTCASVDDVQVDTGSQGLRLLASALPAGFALPAVAAGSGSAPAGSCAAFGSGYTWGAVRSADVKLAGEVAAALPIQLIADPSVPTTPSACKSFGLAMMNSTALRSNGILGVGPFSADCGAACVNGPNSSWYYACPSGNCTPSAQPLAQQISNPVAAFASDNNGVVVDLPAIAGTGESKVSGSLIFGIGSQANNALGSATVLRGNSVTGFVSTTTSDGTVYSQSYIDSGSNGFFFANTTLTRCGVWFCPGSPQSLGATLKGVDGVSASTSLSVANATSLFATGNWAFNNLAGYNGSAFGWGLPFFFGRRVYTAIQAQTTPAGAGPYYAF